MIVGIIIGVCIVGGMVFGGRKAFKKLKKDKSKDQEKIDKQFEDGKILLPIDKRDFEDLDEFKEKTSHIKSVKKQLDNIDNDFKKLEFKDWEDKKDGE